MNDVARQGHGLFTYEGQKWALVSIHTDGHGDSKKFLTDGVKEALVRKGMCECLSLRFWDIIGDDKVGIDRLLAFHYKPIIFDEKMARRVVRLVDRMIADPEPVVFVAHCDAGVSRSGSVALFAVERAGKDIGEFFNENPNVDPNPFVLRLLKKVAGMEYVPLSAEEVVRQMAEKEGRANAAADRILDKYGMIFM